MEGLIAVKSRTKEPQTLIWDGRPFYFGGEGEKDSIRILPAVMQGHVETRHTVRHQTVTDKDGKIKILPTLEAVMLFKVIPLDEALKAGAALEENPSVVEARRQAAEKEKIEAELTDRIMSRLIEKGWTPPTEAAEPRKVGRPRKEDK